MSNDQAQKAAGYVDAAISNLHIAVSLLGQKDKRRMLLFKAVIRAEDAKAELEREGPL